MMRIRDIMNNKYILQEMNLPFVDKEEKLNVAKNNVKIIINIMKYIKD